MATTDRTTSDAKAAPAPGRAGRRWPLVGAAALGAALALIVAAGAWLLLGGGVRGGDTDARLTRIESQLAALAHNGNGTGAPDSKALDDLSRRLARIETRLAEQAAAIDRQVKDQVTEQVSAQINAQVKPLTDRLADLDHRDQEIMAASQVARDRADAAAKSLADVAQQLAQLNAERARMPQVQHADLDALAARLTSLENTTRAIGEQLSHMAGAAAAGNTRQAVLAIALNAAVQRGTPYARELAAIDPSVAGSATIAALKPFADTGVPSAAALAHELADLLPAARAALDSSPPGGFFQRLQSNAERLVRIHPVGQAPGDEPAQVLARLDAKAAQGDIAGALAEAGKLTASVRAPLDPWIKRAEARDAALAAASTLAMRSLDMIRRPPAQGPQVAPQAGPQGPPAQ